MKNWLTPLSIIVPLSIILGIITGCQTVYRNDESFTIEATETPANNLDIPLEMVEVGEKQIRQWAVDAEATSEYANPEWSAMQATGAPNTFRCGDYQTAWSSAASDSVSQLTLRYSEAVYVTQVNIIETFNPNQVQMVELVGNFDRAIVIYDKQPSQVDQSCPFTLTVPVERTEERYDTIRITLDQSILGLGWNQIDAVELIGLDK